MTDAAVLRRLHGEGKTLGECARTLGRSGGLISQKAEDMGLSWDRERTRKAVEALKADAAERRARLAMRHLEHAERTLDRLDQTTYRTLIKGDRGADVVADLDFIPAEEYRLLTITGKTHEEAAIKLDLHDAPRAQTVEVSGPGGEPLVTDGHAALMAALGTLKQTED
jgi:hypothetical protein